MFIKKNDTVKVITGDDRGKKGKVIKVFPEKGRALVQGVNFVWKHLKRSSDYPHGARIQKEAPVRISNMMLVCPNCNKATRVAYRQPESGQKNRVCKKCKQPVSE